MSKLDSLVAAAREDTERRRSAVPANKLKQQLRDRTQAGLFAAVLTGPGLALIAEFKRRSPSGGDIRPGAGVAEVVSAYERGGAAAVSILTDERHFGGSLADLETAREACTLPLLRKDFIVDPYQLYEAAASGADAVLLIVAALEDEALRELHAEGRELGLDCLVEVHNRPELARALELDCELIGINNRDLRTLSVSLETTAELFAEIPTGIATVAESGYETREQLEELERIGVDAVLIGETLMRAPDPEAIVRELTGP